MQRNFARLGRGQASEANLGDPIASPTLELDARSGTARQ
jgi:hypothetical protein